LFGTNNALDLPATKVARSLPRYFSNLPATFFKFFPPFFKLARPVHPSIPQHPTTLQQHHHHSSLITVTVHRPINHVNEQLELTVSIVVA
jgi:hypothetical protein